MEAAIWEERNVVRKIQAEEESMHMGATYLAFYKKNFEPQLAYTNDEFFPLRQACALLQHVACTRSLHVGCASPATNSPVWLAICLGLACDLRAKQPLERNCLQMTHLRKKFIKVPHRGQFAGPCPHRLIYIVTLGSFLSFFKV